MRLNYRQEIQFESTVLIFARNVHKKKKLYTNY